MPSLLETGIAQGLVRISVGLEDVEDLTADLTNGLAAARDVLAQSRDRHPAAQSIA